MLTIITDKHSNRKYQELLKEKLSESLKDNIDTTIGFPSGNYQTNVIHNSQIWYNSYEINEDGKTRRYWNGFGLSKSIKTKKSLDISVEINIPFTGVNRQVSGFFAKDESTGEIFLMHRGKIGGGRKGIGKNAFINWAGLELIEVIDGEKTSRVIKIANLNNNDLARNIASFVAKVSNFKTFITTKPVDAIELLSIEQLYTLATERSAKKTEKYVVDTYIRDPIIAEIAKRKAKGKCQLCCLNAPFTDKFGKPYLETHHIDWLSTGGEDTVENTIALCPNCHRKMHSLALPEDIALLRERAKYTLLNEEM